MASIPPPRAHEPLTGPQHFTPPSARELRAQAVQRLQAGLFGLAAVLLVVGLANIINDRARLTARAENFASGQPSPTASPGASDPLVDIGVMPSSVPSEAPSASASPAPSQNGLR
jgi:hypothetical protein